MNWGKKQFLIAIGYSTICFYDKAIKCGYFFFRNDKIIFPLNKFPFIRDGAFFGKLNLWHQRHTTRNKNHLHFSLVLIPFLNVSINDVLEKCEWIQLSGRKSLNSTKFKNIFSHLPTVLTFWNEKYFNLFNCSSQKF